MSKDDPLDNGMFLVKVQRSIAGSGIPSLLIYNEDRSIMLQVGLVGDPLTDRIIEVMGDSLKEFFWANVTREGNLNLELMLGAQPDPGW